MTVYFISEADWANGFDAKIELDGTAICLHSRGGATGGRPPRNTQYSSALITILRRLLVTDIESEPFTVSVLMDSLPARKKSMSQRKLVDGAELAGLDAEAAAKLIRSRVRDWGQPPGATGGNSTRAIRIETKGLSSSALRAKLKLMLWDGKPGRMIQRLTNAQQREVSAAHVHKAVQRLVAGEDAPNFADSRDYDVRLDDGTRLAPKKVFGLAIEEALQIEAFPEHFSAGWSQPSFEIIEAAGYRIVPKSAPSLGEVANALDSLPHEQGDVDAIEGSLKLVAHFKRERASGLSKKKKAAFVAEHGHLFCERCGLVPRETYDAHIADACIEVHHATTQVKDMSDGHLTNLNDLQCLCANCHRVTHRELTFVTL